MKIYDISPLIHEGIAVWPNDTPFSRNVILDTNNGNNITLSSITTTLHLGAHTDAPSHYAQEEGDIASRSLDYYIGKCQIIDADVKRGERITPKHLRANVCAPRVLFRTNTFPDPDSWNSDFAALSAELIHFLHKQKVLLVGIDTPSIDLQDDKHLEAHSAIYQHNMAILEGVVLTNVESGIYELIALPLKMKSADASPVRAILRELP